MATVKKKIRDGDYQWFDVTLEDGEPILVVQCRNVWSAGKDHTGSSSMSERIRRVIEAAKSPDT